MIFSTLRSWLICTWVCAARAEKRSDYRLLAGERGPGAGVLPRSSAIINSSFTMRAYRPRVLGVPADEPGLEMGGAGLPAPLASQIARGTGAGILLRWVWEASVFVLLVAAAVAIFEFM